MKKFVLGSVFFSLVVIAGVSTPQRAQGFIDGGITWCCIGPIGWGWPSFGWGWPSFDGGFGPPVIIVSRSIVIDIQIPSDIGDRLISLQQNQSTKRPDVFLPTDFPSGAATQIACVLNRMENLPSGTQFKLKTRLKNMVFWNFEIVILDPKEWAKREGKDPEDAPYGRSRAGPDQTNPDNIKALPPDADFDTKLKIEINVSGIEADVNAGLHPRGVTVNTAIMKTFMHELTHYVLGQLEDHDHPNRAENEREFWISRFGSLYARLWKELFGVEHYQREHSRGHPYTLPPCTPGGTFGFGSLGLNFGRIIP